MVQTTHSASPGVGCGRCSSRSRCHKSRKRPFRLRFWATVLANCLGLLLLAYGAP